VLDIQFLAGCARPTIAVLYEDSKAYARHIKTYEVSLKDKVGVVVVCSTACMCGWRAAWRGSRGSRDAGLELWRDWVQGSCQHLCHTFGVCNTQPAFP
jgi:hypothetical protein